MLVILLRKTEHELQAFRISRASFVLFCSLDRSRLTKRSAAFMLRSQHEGSETRRLSNCQKGRFSRQQGLSRCGASMCGLRPRHCDEIPERIARSGQGLTKSRNLRTPRTCSISGKSVGPKASKALQERERPKRVLYTSKTRKNQA